MAGFDRRGPEGRGPGTGRRNGYCFGFGDIRNGGFGMYGGRGMGRGMNSRRGCGWGSQMGFRSGPGPFTAAYYEDVYPKDEEKKMLKDEARLMQERLDDINTRLSELDNSTRQDSEGKE